MRTHRSKNLTIGACDGFALAASLFGCRRHRRLGTLIIAGAVGNVRHNYAPYAGYMAEQGWDVITFDYRGIGGSRAPQDQAASFRMLDWGAKDLAGVIDWARGQLQPRRLVLVGHSIGGQVAGFADNHDGLSGMVAVAAQRGYWRYWDSWRKYVVYLFWRVGVPLCLRTCGFLPLAAVGLEGLPRRVAQDWARWGLAREYQDEDCTPLGPRFARFTAPILALSISDDPSLAPRRAVDALFREQYIHAPVTRWHICPEDFGVRWLGHSGFFSPQVCPESLWQATSAWILRTCPESAGAAPHDQQLPPRPATITAKGGRP
jgi:predicted alpha/beta hydrolase